MLERGCLRPTPRRPRSCARPKADGTEIESSGQLTCPFVPECRLQEKRTSALDHELAGPSKGGERPHHEASRRGRPCPGVASPSLTRSGALGSRRRRTLRTAASPGVVARRADRPCVTSARVGSGNGREVKGSRSKSRTTRGEVRREVRLAARKRRARTKGERSGKDKRVELGSQRMQLRPPNDQDARAHRDEKKKRGGESKLFSKLSTSSLTAFGGWGFAAHCLNREGDTKATGGWEHKIQRCSPLQWGRCRRWEPKKEERGMRGGVVRGVGRRGRPSRWIPLSSRTR